MVLPETADRSNLSLLLAGAVIVLVSLTAAAWMLVLGDLVTAVGLGLLVAAGVLLAGIGLSPDPALH